MKVVISADTKAELTAKVDEYLDTRLGPAIAADASRYAPKRTGLLASSITHQVEGHALYVVANTDYAVFVELGHWIVPWRRKDKSEKSKWAPAQPYLRTALYIERDV